MGDGHDVHETCLDDAVLVGRVLGGDGLAFAELYDRHARLIRCICHDECRDADTAADLTQEAFLRAYARLRELRDRGQFRHWLMGIARRVCREHRRRQRRTARPPPQVETPSYDGPSPGERDESIARLREAIAELPANERLALHAFYLSEMNAEDARQTLGLSRSGLYHVLASARARLRRMLQREEILR